MLLWLWGLQSHKPFQKNAHASVGGIARRFGLKTLLMLLRPHTQHPSAQGLPTQHAGVYHVKEVNLETWQEALRGPSLIPRSPLTCPLGLLKRLLTSLLKPKNTQKLKQWRIVSSMVSPPISPNVSPPRPDIDRR